MINTTPNAASPGCRYKTGFFGGKFLPFHRGHLDAIIRCAAECEHLYVVVMHHGAQENEIRADYKGRLPFDCLDLATRLHAMRAELSVLGNVEVLSYDCRESDERARLEGVHPWTYECLDMVELMGRFDVAYSSEPEYSENFRFFYPWADAVVVDAERLRYPISATQLRNMTFAQAYPHLPREFQRLVNRKVLITGTESCGKSTLVRKLAARLNTTHTEEQGRLVCERYGVSSPKLDLYPSFVYAQKDAERVANENANMVVICDTDAIVTAFYAEEYKGARLDIAYEAAKASGYDKVLFVEPTVAWVDDGLRTMPEQAGRERQAARLKEMYAEAGYELEVLAGDYRGNYEKALASIQELLGIGEAI